MRSIWAVVLLTGCLVFSNPAKADSWIDPTWKRMLDSSDVVALIRYTSNGDFRASARIIKLYKGSVSTGDEIWVSGFSNRYGPIDKMSKGDEYLVFLNLTEPSEKQLEYWNEELLENPGLKDFITALKNRKAYSVWTPTSGDLKVKKGKVQYDLVQTTVYKNQKYYPLPRFEKFLSAYYDHEKGSILINELLGEVKPASEEEEKAQHLMMLYLLKYSTYHAVLADYVKVNNSSSRYALALLMGNMGTDQSKQVLLALLKDKHSLVQGEAVRQLSTMQSDEIGAVLLKQLEEASPYNAGPGNIMNPVMNRMDGGHTQIVKTLGDMGYKPAIPVLLKMLDTKEDYEFERIVKTLRKLGTREYAGYISRHLESLDHSMVLQLCFIIRDDSLAECIPSLMNYVNRHDKTVWPTKEYAVSKDFGLAYFKSDTVKQFLSADFAGLMKMPNTNREAIDTKQKWVKEYISSFIELGIGNAKNELYNYMYDQYGFNSAFVTDEAYFRRKKEIEDSLINIVERVLKPVQPDVRVKAAAWIDSSFNLVDYSVKYEIDRSNIYYQGRRTRLDTLNQVVYSQTSIDRRHLIWSSGYYTGLDGAINFGSIGDGFTDSFLNYVATFAGDEDVRFIGNLVKYQYATTDYEKKMLDQYLEKANAAIRR
ncbi:MAG: HEAT repeat domain-containing protein [Chitinophagaceae bacterium]|nr:HEAT repeat domain-containing protein [Chitinophagaceae bacterium]